jgi:hypothetical protein
MELSWGRVGYLAIIIFPIREHVHAITKLPKTDPREHSELLLVPLFPSAGVKKEAAPDGGLL